MPNFQRRDFLTRAAAFAAVTTTLGGAGRVAAGDPSRCSIHRATGAKHFLPLLIGSWYFTGYR